MSEFDPFSPFLNSMRELDDLRTVTDTTDEFGQPWDPANHVDPVDAQWQPDEGDQITPGEFLLY